VFMSPISGIGSSPSLGAQGPPSIGLFAGPRREEIARLDWKEVDLDRGFVEVHAAKAKTARRRLVPISDNLREWIAPHRQLSGPVPPKKHMTYRRRFAEALKAAGISHWPSNGLRHTFASCQLAFHQTQPRRVCSWATPGAGRSWSTIVSW
jgi:integrase